MKNRIIISVLGFFVAGSMLLHSCTKNDDNTIALIGTEYYVDDILSVIPDSLQTQFLAEFGSIPSGYVPPKIEGSYVMDPKLRVSSNVEVWPLQIQEPNMYFRFSSQQNGLIEMTLNESIETVTDTVFVCGSDNAFAVYVIEEKAYEIVINNQTYHARMKRGVIMKGQVVADGLKDFRYATIIMETEDDSNGQIGQYGNGSYFIYRDGDGIAKNQDW